MIAGKRTASRRWIVSCSPYDSSNDFAPFEEPCSQADFSKAAKDQSRVGHCRVYQRLVPGCLTCTTTCISLYFGGYREKVRHR
jgi:hypothetical protein